MHPISTWKRYSMKRIAVWVGLWILIALTAYTLLGWEISTTLLAFGMLFYYTDIYLVDGWLVWFMTKILGSKIPYRAHTAVIGTWKPPVLTLQIVAVLLAMNGTVPVITYYVTLGIELAFFYITFTMLHNFPHKKALLAAGIIAGAMALGFTYSEMASLIAELSGQGI